MLILSKEFFICTKLEAFVEAHKKDPEKIAILPVYLGLSRDECKNEGRRSEWLSKWEEWAARDDRIDVGKWKEALRVLGPLNGIEYVQSLGEVTLREQIVSAIQGLVPPEITWSAGQIQGRTRICKAICEKFERTEASPWYGVCVVGIYGTGGIGKTTFSKVLCDELFTKFKGKVCHGELGMKSSFDLQKQVLKDLTDINEGILKGLTNEDKTTNLLKQYIHQHQVFLALDNVWPESIEEAKLYLRVGFHVGSIVMVTARAIDVLASLNIDRSDCLEMPELEEEDAKHLFLHHAAPPGVQFKNDDDEQRILHCVRVCKFQKGVEMGEHFHPLALKVLGAELGSLGFDPQMWVENLDEGDEDTFNQFGEKEHPIFSVLRRGYDSLSEEDQLLFMDSVLFHPPQRFTTYLSDDAIPFSTGGMRNKFRLDIYEWLSSVHHHQIDVRKIQKRLQGLKAKSLIEDIGDGIRGVIVHELYLEFAEMEVKRGTLGGRRWVWCNEEEAYPDDLAMTPSSNCWVNVRRVSLKHDPSNECNGWNGIIEGFNWQHFSNITVLQLYISINEVLDLSALRCLRSLEVKWGDLGHSGQGMGEGKLDGLRGLKSLKWLELYNIHYAPCFEELGCLTTLEVLRLDAICEYKCKREPLSPPKLENCIHLRELMLRRCVCLKAFPNLSRLISLKKVFFMHCNSAKEVVGLTSEMRALKELLLIGCDSLSQICGLSDVVSLEELCVIDCRELRELPNLGKLMKLEQLSIKGKFNEPLGFSGSMPLKELMISGVEALPDLGLLRDLQRLTFGTFSGSMLPNFGGIIALEEICLHHLSEVQELPEMHELSRLRSLTVQDAPKLHRLVLGDLVGLQHLNLRLYTELSVRAEVPDLYRLGNLQSLVLASTTVRSLPSLTLLTRLRELDCRSSTLEDLPDLTGLTLLERIDLSECAELTSLGSLANLPALEYLNVGGCCELEMLPDLRSFKRLRYLNLCRTGVRLSHEDIVALPTSLAHVVICDHFVLNVPKMLHERMLEKKSLTAVSSGTEVSREEADEVLPEVYREVVMEIEAKQLEFFDSADFSPDSDCMQCFGDYYDQP